MSLFTAPTPLPGPLPPPVPSNWLPELLGPAPPWPRLPLPIGCPGGCGRAVPRRGGGGGGGGRCGVWLRSAPVGRRRDGPGAAAEELPGGRGGLRGAALGFPRPHPAVQGLVRGGRGLPGHRRGKRHVLGHLHQGREALGPHGAAEGLWAGRLPLLHQPREPQGEGAGRQSLRFARLLLGTPQPAGPDRGLGEAAAGGGIGAVLPLPPQKQPDRGRRQPAEHRHSGQGVFKEEEHGAGGAVQGDGGAQAGILGGLHPAARRCGVLAGPNQPPARPHRLPPPAGWLGPPGRHDAPGRGRVGLRTLRPVRLLVSLAAFARSGVSPVPNLSPIVPWETGLVSLCPSPGDTCWWGAPVQPQRPSSPFASPWGGREPQVGPRDQLLPLASTWGATAGG